MVKVVTQRRAIVSKEERFLKIILPTEGYDYLTRIIYVKAVCVQMVPLTFDRVVTKK